MLAEKNGGWKGGGSAEGTGSNDQIFLLFCPPFLIHEKEISSVRILPISQANKCSIQQSVGLNSNCIARPPCLHVESKLLGMTHKNSVYVQGVNTNHVIW